jgi:hypothetical protein
MPVGNYCSAKGVRGQVVIVNGRPLTGHESLLLADVETSEIDSPIHVLPPGMPKDRVQILRKAFIDTVKNPEFLADANKARLDINLSTAPSSKKMCERVST